MPESTPANATLDERAFWIRRYELLLHINARTAGERADEDLAALRAQLAARPWLAVREITASESDTLACDSPQLKRHSPNPTKPHVR